VGIFYDDTTSWEEINWVRIMIAFAIGLPIQVVYFPLGVLLAAIIYGVNTLFWRRSNGGGSGSSGGVAVGTPRTSTTSAASLYDDDAEMAFKVVLFPLYISYHILRLSGIVVLDDDDP